MAFQESSAQTYAIAADNAHIGTTILQSSGLKKNSFPPTSLPPIMPDPYDYFKQQSCILE